MVRGALEASCAAWNHGDLDLVCADYAEDARYLNAAGLAVGKDAILACYKCAYPEGTVTHLDLELIDFIPRVSTATVRWTLRYAQGGEYEGLCTLVYVLKDGQLQVVYDNSW